MINWFITISIRKNEFEAQINKNATNMGQSFRYALHLQPVGLI